MAEKLLANGGRAPRSALEVVILVIFVIIFVKTWFLGARGAPASWQLTEFQPRFSIFSVQALRACTEKIEKRD